MADQDLYQELVKVLTLCEAFGLRFQKINLDDAPTLQGFADLIASKGVTADVLRENQREICLLREFPTPGDIVALCEASIDADLRRRFPITAVPYNLPPLEGQKGSRAFVGRPGMTLEEQEEEWLRQNPVPAVPSLTQEQKDHFKTRREAMEEQDGEVL